MVSNGVFPGPYHKHSRGKRWHMLPVYAEDGIVLGRVYSGSVDNDLFEDFVTQLLHHCNPYPKKRSVIVADNASWHRSKKSPTDVSGGRSNIGVPIAVLACLQP